LLTDVASCISAQPAIIAALEELEATPRRRRRQVETTHVGR
jgi:hypothetical protein